MIPAETTIGWIGAGKMGLPICHRMKDKGFKVRVLGRSAATRKSLADAGFMAHDSVPDLVANSDVIFTSVSDDAALDEVVHSAVGHFKANATLIDISTVSPQLSTKLAELLQAKKVHYLRSPVSGSTSMAQAGTLTAVVSGPKPIFEGMEQAFSAFTRKAFHVGKAEEARYLKLVLNSMVAATASLLGEALAFGRKGGLDNTTMLDVITQSAIASPLIAYKRDMIVTEDYRPAASLALLMKDLDLLLSESRESHCPMPISALVRQIYEQGFVKGLGEQDFFVLVQNAAKNAGFEK
jgi:3-hydroxyisobutyrate dehydrogenase-like beta-hydroxyacid dehydrogenase